MDRVEKIDFRANGEVILGAVRALDPDSMEYPNRWDVQGRFLGKRNGVRYRVIHVKNNG